MDTEWYVLFPNHENGLRLYKALKNRQLYAVIAPTPRALSKSCGISLKIKEEEKEEVERCALSEKVQYIGIGAFDKNGEWDER